MSVVNISFGWFRYSFHDVKRFNPDLVSIATGVLLELIHYNALSNSAQKDRLHESVLNIVSNCSGFVVLGMPCITFKSSVIYAFLMRT